MPKSSSVFRVDDWIVTPRRCTIEKNGQSVHVKPKCMAVLKCLAGADGHVVTRNELFDAVWPNSAVTDDVLTQCIVELRKAFGDSAQNPHFIETVPKIGFRLIPPVTCIDAETGSDTKWRMKTVIVALISVTLLVFAYDQWIKSAPPITSIAVLPLASLSDDPEQVYFTYGITDVLTSELGQIGGLSVISRTSADVFEDSDKTLPEIARELGVDALVEGSVQSAESEVRITLQLIDGRTDRHLWSRDYRRDLQDVLTLQGEIAREIADEIAIALTPQLQARMVRERRAEPEAIRLWVVGHHQLLQDVGQLDSTGRALRSFKEAAARDPDFAPAYAAMATAYVFQGSWMGRENPNVVLPLAISAAHKALELDPFLADAHFALGQIHWLNWQWEAVEREFRKGRELNPSHSSGLIEYANFLTAMGRAQEAIEVATQAVRLDPFSPVAYNELAFAYWASGQLDETKAWFDKSLELDPDNWQTTLLAMDLYLELGQPDKALFYLNKVRENVEGHLSESVGYAASTYAKLGHEDEARELLAQLQLRLENKEPVRAFAMALIYAALGEHDAALDWLGSR